MTQFSKVRLSTLEVMQTYLAQKKNHRRNRRPKKQRQARALEKLSPEVGKNQWTSIYRGNQVSRDRELKKLDLIPFFSTNKKQGMCFETYVFIISVTE